jgi:hypothetical protein
MTLIAVARFHRLCQDVTNACVQEALSPGTEAGLRARHIIAVLQTSHASSAFAGTGLKLK